MAQKIVLWRRIMQSINWSIKLKIERDSIKQIIDKIRFKCANGKKVTNLSNIFIEIFEKFNINSK